MTLADDVLALVTEVFGASDMVGIVKRAVIRYSIIGDYVDGAAEVIRVDLPCRAFLNSQAGAQASLEIRPRIEEWFLEGVPRTLAGGAWSTLEPDSLMQDRQFEPAEGQLLLIERPSGPELAEWTGGVMLEADAKAITAAAEFSVGIGALWQVTAMPLGAPS
jgi:hypothetical protein